MAGKLEAGDGQCPQLQVPAGSEDGATTLDTALLTIAAKTWLQGWSTHGGLCSDRLTTGRFAQP